MKKWKNEKMKKWKNEKMKKWKKKKKKTFFILFFLCFLQIVRRSLRGLQVRVIEKLVRGVRGGLMEGKGRAEQQLCDLGVVERPYRLIFSLFYFV